MTHYDANDAATLLIRPPRLALEKTNSALGVAIGWQRHFRHSAFRPPRSLTGSIFVARARSLIWAAILSRLIAIALSPAVVPLCIGVIVGENAALSFTE